MQIESIHIEHFGRLNSVDLKFHKDLNIIEGANESGKSTLAAFIRFMLYGFPQRTNTGRLSEKQKRLSWEHGVCEGSMILTVGEKRYEIRRFVPAPGSDARESVSVTDLKTGLPAHSRKEPGDAFLEVPEELFLSTAFVGDLSSTQVEGRGMAEAIENLIFSGDEKINTDRARTELSQARGSLLHPSGKGGALFTLRQKQDALFRRLSIAKSEHAKILHLESELSQFRKKKADSLREIEYNTKLETDYNNVKTIKAYDYLHELEENIDVLDHELLKAKQNAKIGDVIPDAATVERLARYRSDIREKAEKAEASKERVKALEDTPPVDKPTEKLLSYSQNHGGESVLRERAASAAFRRTLYLVFMIVFFAACLASLPLDFFVFKLDFSDIGKLPIILTLAVKAALFLTGTIFLLLYISAEKSLRTVFRAVGAHTLPSLREVLTDLTAARQSLARYEGELSEARRLMVETDEAYLDLSEEIMRYLLQFGDSFDPENAEECLLSLISRIEENLRDIEEMETKRARTQESIREIRNRLGDKNEIQVRATVPPGDRERIAALNAGTIALAIRDARRHYHFNEDKENEHERKLAAARLGAEDPLLLQAEMEQLSEKIDAMLLRLTAYDLAIDSLNTAGERLRTEISPRLARYACHLMNIATDGKYSTLTVSSNIDLGFTEKDTVRDAAYLSAGTQDVAYLSLRMSLVDLLYSEMPPLFFDESFAHQDDTRAVSLLRALRVLCDEGKQLFVFTCHSREAALSANIFNGYSHIKL